MVATIVFCISNGFIFGACNYVSLRTGKFGNESCSKWVPVVTVWKSILSWCRQLVATIRPCIMGNSTKMFITQLDFQQNFLVYPVIFLISIDMSLTILHFNTIQTYEGHSKSYWNGLADPQNEPNPLAIIKMYSLENLQPPLHPNIYLLTYLFTVESISRSWMENGKSSSWRVFWGSKFRLIDRSLRKISN